MFGSSCRLVAKSRALHRARLIYASDDVTDDVTKRPETIKSCDQTGLETEISISASVLVSVSVLRPNR